MNDKKLGKRNKKFFKFCTCVLIFFFFAFQMNLAGEEQDPNYPLQRSQYTIITVISEHYYEIEVKFKFINITNNPIDQSYNVMLVPPFTQEYEAKWSPLHKDEWKDVPSDRALKSKDREHFNVAETRGFRVKTIAKRGIIFEEDGSKSLGFEIDGLNAVENEIELRLPLKEGLFYHLEVIDKRRAPNSEMDTEEYKILRWDDPISVNEEGWLTNGFFVNYRYRVSFKKYFIDSMKVIGVALIGVFLGALLSERIKKLLRRERRRKKIIRKKGN